MYTQCQHCKAIFRVNMREVTVAQGKLRCGECDQVFNASDSLSTSMPTSYDDSITNDQPRKNVENYNKNHTNKTSNTFTVKEVEVEVEEKIKKIRKPLKINWFVILALLLFALLLSQIFYNNRHFFLGTPLNQPEKIQMLNHNIFAHPIESGVLLISALIENTAEQAQPYPILELRLKNSQSKLIALRRFSPREYLEKYDKNSLIPVKKPISLKLKIKDPGRKATHFQFEFL